MESLPFPLQILQGADKHDVLELMVVKVAGSQGHDEVPEADQRGFHVSEDAHDHVAAEEGHGRLAAGLVRAKKTPKAEAPVNQMLLVFLESNHTPRRRCSYWMDGWMDG